ncbi:MAG TPA: mechanosensitive ion channel domain-containing protein [Candidatus Krumholzibacteria bacterium]|nr:mechanosensitive ion channel domain-containing protein [Candidatus Krumholzibacteria bacterium]
MKTRFRIVRAMIPAVFVWLALTAPSLGAESDEPAVIRFHNRDIATLRATLGPVDPQERAAAALERLRSSTPGDLRRPVTVVPFEESRALLLGDRILFVLVTGDVDVSAGETVNEAAEQAAANLRVAFASWADQRRPEVVARGVIHVLVATAIGLVLLFLLLRLRRFLLNRLIPRAERAIEKRRFVVFGQDLRRHALNALRISIGALYAISVVVVVYSWLMYSLRQFPLTQPWGDGLADFLLDTLGMIGVGILHGIPEMVVVVLVLVVTRFFARVVAGIFDAVERGQVTIRGVHPDTADATRRIATVLVWIFGIAIAYPFIPGSQSDAFKGISVLVGLMVSLGSSGVISQAMSGMVVVFSRALKAGEYVCIGDYEGTVSEVGALSTKLRTVRNEEINIPNAMLVSSTTKNYSRLAKERGIIVYATAGIGYDAPWRVVHRLLIDAALRTPGIKHEPAPFVRQSALGSFAVDYTINAYLERAEDRLPVLSDLHANIQDGFNEAGIQIMTPAFESQPAEPVVVPKSMWGEGEGRNPR